MRRRRSAAAARSPDSRRRRRPRPSPTCAALSCAEHDALSVEHVVDRQDVRTRPAGADTADAGGVVGQPLPALGVCQHADGGAKVMLLPPLAHRQHRRVDAGQPGRRTRAPRALGRPARHGSAVVGPPDATRPAGPPWRSRSRPVAAEAAVLRRYPSVQGPVATVASVQAPPARCDATVASTNATPSTPSSASGHVRDNGSAGTPWRRSTTASAMSV